MHKSNLSLVLAAILLTPIAANSRPLDPDYGCFLIDHANRAINLERLCSIGRGEVLNNPVTVAPTLAPSEESKQARSPGKVSIVSGNTVKIPKTDRWTITGRVRNDTGEQIRRVIISVEYSVNGAVIGTDSISLDQDVLNPDNMGTFSTNVRTKDRPSYNITSIQWSRPDGSIATYP